MKKGFVFIPGAGMSDWIWTKLKPLLHLDYVTVSRRIENNTYENRLKCDFEDIMSYANQIIEQSGFDEVILVGHSGAGLIAGELGKRNPKIKHIIFLAANIPVHNETALDSFSEEIRNKNIEGVKMQAKADTIPMKMLEAQFRTYFCNQSLEEDINYLMEQSFQPEPLCVLTHQVDWSDYPEIGMTYVISIEDKTISVAQQEQFASNLGIRDIARIDGDHMMMISRAKELSELLNYIAENNLQEKN
jgi:surfactin synthase thioesterase subunit